VKDVIKLGNADIRFYREIMSYPGGSFGQDMPWICREQNAGLLQCRGRFLEILVERFVDFIEILLETFVDSLDLMPAEK
jgi:hypothetical protein